MMRPHVEVKLRVVGPAHPMSRGPTLPSLTIPGCYYLVSTDWLTKENIILFGKPTRDGAVEAVLRENQWEKIEMEGKKNQNGER